MKYDHFKHKRRSIRLKEYNYASEGCYFITLCCKDRLPIFGSIKNNEMQLNEYGLIAQNEWLNTLQKRQHILLDEFIVMPNHIHGIIVVTNRLTDKERGVCDTPLHSPSNTIGAIIRGYKSAVTSQLKEKIGSEIWQRNYYEHIIRNETAFNQIRQYIMNNPFTWEQDRFFIS